MDIQTFLHKTAGDWFSQRTIYTINENQVDNSKANLTINWLSATETKVISLAQQHNLNLDLSLGAISSQWDNSPDWGKPQQQGSSLMLLFTDDNNSSTGQIIRVLNQNQILKGKYILAEDKSLTLIIEQDVQVITERIEFASDNLRLRNTVVKNQGTVTETSFYSEIKRIVKKDN
jgi:hypothetical protein